MFIMMQRNTVDTLTSLEILYSLLLGTSIYGHVFYNLVEYSLNILLRGVPAVSSAGRNYTCLTKQNYFMEAFMYQLSDLLRY